MKGVYIKKTSTIYDQDYTPVYRCINILKFCGGILINSYGNIQHFVYMNPYVCKILSVVYSFVSLII